MPIYEMTSGDQYDYIIPADRYGHEIRMQITFSGAVLQKYERNGYDDSDFYAIVWNGSEIEHVEYATTRGWTYPNGAKVDATPEVLAQVETYLLKIKRHSLWNCAEKELSKIEVGKSIEIVKGRKVAKGITGTIIRIMSNDYDKDNRRIVFRDDAGNVYNTYEENVKVIVTDTPDIEEVCEKATYLVREMVRSMNFRMW